MSPVTHEPDVGTARPFTRRLAAEIANAAHPLTGAPSDFDALLALAADRQFVLLGEATHGTHEFYRVRAEITKQLITRHGFAGVAVEGDWPDAYRVNRYVRGIGSARDGTEALDDFVRFPQWMWRNADVLDFVGWLRHYNDGRDDATAAGFYGLDLYSLHASIDAVLAYLRKVDPESAVRALQRYNCFAYYGGDPQRYGYATGVEALPSCEGPVVRQLVELRARTAEYVERDGRLAADDHFFADQNALLVVDAERYYRAMYRGGSEAWNLRDRHMAATLYALERHLAARRNGPAKLVVWAHNSHLGDAGATQMSQHGETNVGQLVRLARGEHALLVGFTTYDGTVTAASNWDEPAERKRVRAALADSYEALFHETGHPRFFLDLRENGTAELLDRPRLERAIGVIYRPETERVSHYFSARLPQQFDAVFHYDRTRAVEPLERSARWVAGEQEVPETFPSAL